ncbi:MAG TPA: RpiB/LacA/LacB family sugar-phosphate isomerase [Candidatus Saccharibacteria bacterium]|jgi:ribose 5-phosphate isomerase B|nr:RpiB/LacA/LacB family sugar-phosphate isomerase [Candidatus Saccharibacteria bacterium]
MYIYVAADHKGYGLKQMVLDYLKKAGYTTEDVGSEHFDPEDDFPIIAARAIHKLQASQHEDPKAILICGSGQGMVMAANRFKGIRAGLGYSLEAAKSIRNDEDSNVLALPADLLQGDDRQKANVIIEAWLNTPFANAARFIRRNKELDNIANSLDQ